MTNDLANRLISELRLRNDKELANFIREKNLSFQDTTELLICLLQNYYREFIFSIYRWLRQNLGTLIEKYSNELVSIMEVISNKDPTYITGLLSDLPELNLDIGHLTEIYAITNKSQDRQMRISSGFFLGEIGIVQPEIMLEEIYASLNASDESKKIACLRALLVASNKYRDTHFTLTDDTIRFIVDCTKSSNAGLSSEAIYASVVLFERDPRFKTTLQEYFDRSPQHRMQIYQYIQYIDLNDMQFELSLVDKCVNSQVYNEHLKYLNRVSHIPDRARSKLIEKLTDQIKDYANKTASPIILCI